MTYTYLASSMSTGELLAELPLTDVRWGRQLNGSGRLTAKLKLRPLPNRTSHPTESTAARQQNALWKDATDRKRRAIYVLRDGTPMGAWMIHSRRYSLADQTIEIRAWELPSYFGGRLATTIFHDGPITGVPIQVAKDFIDLYPFIQLDTTSGVTIPPSGPTVTVEHLDRDGKWADEVIADLQKGAGDHGFDWRIDLVGQAPDFTRLLVMAPVVGGDVGLIAKITRPEGRGNVLEAAVEQDERRANLVVALGAGDGAERARSSYTEALWTPRIDAVVTIADEEDTDVLFARAKAHHRAVQDMTVTDVTVRADELDAQLGTFAPGDVGQIAVEPDADPWWPDGQWLTQRIVGFEVAVPDSQDGETVTFAFDDPVGDF